MPDPNGAWRRIGRLIDRISGLTGFIGALAILAAALVVTEGVVVRKVLGQSTIWQIEFSVFLLIYACFVGAALAQRGEHHLNVDLIIIHLRPKAREIVLLIAAMIGCLICAVVAAYGWPMWWRALVEGEHSESLWGPPMWIPYLFLPLGMTLVFLQYLGQIVRKIQDIRRGRIDAEVVRTELKEIELPAGPEGRGGEAHE